MAYTNEVNEWEGDTTQYGDNYTWESKDYLFDGRVRMDVARVLFESTDLSDYNDELEARADLLARNRAKIAAGVTGILPGGGWDFDGVVLGGDALEEDPGAPTYSGDDTLTFYLYADGVLKHTQTVTSTKPFKLPGGYRSRRWKFKLIGNVAVKRADIASSVHEIMMDNREVE